MKPTGLGARKRNPPPIALTIAGSDSGGGAGIQADLRSFAAFGVHGLSVITAVTAQNTCGVFDIEMLPQRIVRTQIEAVLGDFDVGAIKIGMLGTPALARTISASLQTRRDIPLVLDPVLVATTGAELSRGRLVAAIRQYLLPHASLLTPNVPEAEQLLGRTITNRDHLLDAAHALRRIGAKAVLLKGGHLPGPEVHDVLVTSAGFHWFSHPRIDAEAHGTGCSLAAGIAADLARGASLEDAVAAGIDFVHRALGQAYRPGKGDLVILDHLAARVES